MSDSFKDMALRELARELAPYLVEAFRNELRAHNDAGDAEWFDQKRGAKLLGRNKWCEAVRSRLERNPSDPHARITGNPKAKQRFLLDAVGVSEEMQRANKPPMTLRKTEPAVTAGADKVRQLLRGRV